MWKAIGKAILKIVEGVKNAGKVANKVMHPVTAARQYVNGKIQGKKVGFINKIIQGILGEDKGKEVIAKINKGREIKNTIKDPVDAVVRKTKGKIKSELNDTTRGKDKQQRRARTPGKIEALLSELRNASLNFESSDAVRMAHESYMVVARILRESKRINGEEQTFRLLANLWANYYDELERLVRAIYDDGGYNSWYPYNYTWALAKDGIMRYKKAIYDLETALGVTHQPVFFKRWSEFGDKAIG